MFNKTSDPTSPPLQRPASLPASGASGANGARSVLSNDLRITGEISSAGVIEVMGEIDGTITAQALIVGTEGRVSGSVKAETVEVKGKLDGKVDCQSFAMRASSSVTADVTYVTVLIESGAHIEGRFIKA
jgi:cytoskeletal protein CcmA (bactofilin family)